ncbi:hypothetical protein MKO06_02710 [Gramella sp. GC03-9]|uniref:Uncharacterized protein n=1 Tax=Christiangramia oceanisediminis TaxID=2920386 RepID=A0A9X2I199_9FLAO|nr:hypothetical protein [Gramella oceanisediminis]MCP9198800.1 hypothetical protein [Gramella oceanisediminis]
MKRELIFEDRDKLRSITQDIKDYNPYLDKVKSTYENLEMGEFSDEVFNELKRSTSSIRKRFEEKLDTEIKKAGITMTSVSEKMKESPRKDFEAFEEAVNDLSSFSPNNSGKTFPRPDLSLEDITYMQGKFMISKTDQENILEKHCRIYLETEEEKRLYDKLQNFISVYNDLQEEIDSHNFKYNFGINGVHGVHYHFLQYDKNGKPEIKPGMIKHAMEWPKTLKKINERPRIR